MVKKRQEVAGVSSPRMWGCFRYGLRAAHTPPVFPTHVGVFLPNVRSRERLLSLPHACGGVSYTCKSRNRSPWSSPRMWGCFLLKLLKESLLDVFPTHVGVFLLVVFAEQILHGLPHACGGVSALMSCLRLPSWSSPRMWGCFSEKVLAFRLGIVFPTHVGVFLEGVMPDFQYQRLPHACGGVSTRLVLMSDLWVSSPRMWGCFFTISHVQQAL